MMGVGEKRRARGGHEAAAFGQCYRMQLSSGVYDRCDLAGTSSADAYGCVSHRAAREHLSFNA